MIKLTHRGLLKSRMAAGIVMLCIFLLMIISPIIANSKDYIFPWLPPFIASVGLYITICMRIYRWEKTHGIKLEDYVKKGEENESLD